MKRYTRSLQEHVNLAQRHADYLIERFIRLARLSKTKLDKHIQDHGEITSQETPQEIQDIYRELKTIQEELMCVESYVKEKFPNVADLFDVLKTIDFKDNHGKSDARTDKDHQETLS